MKELMIAFLMFLSFSSFGAGQQETICGAVDNREPSYETEIARSHGRSLCTVTMIGRSCAISAGHCKRSLNQAHFNVPASNSKGKYRRPPSDYIYEIDKKNRVIVDSSSAEADFAIVRVLPHKETDEYAGDVRGFLRVSFDGVEHGDKVRITGHGRDEDDPTRSYTQQTHVGEVIAEKRWYHWLVPPNKKLIYHTSDTMGGNSGAAIVSERTGEIVGIHTNGGCTTRNKSVNRGVSIAHHPALINAIKQCLEWEKNLDL